MVRHLNTDDEGKTVLTHDGKEIGVIEKFEQEAAYVTPEGLVSSTTKRKLDWSDDHDGPYVLRNAMVHSITEDAVRIRQ